MENVPFRTFTGYLKQDANEALSTLEREFFDFLFPAFRGTSDAEETYKQFETGKFVELLATMGSLFQVEPGERRPRRFSGFKFPGRRYFSLCRDAEGDDTQTLAHELRAYRDPVDIGMVEVVDLAHGCALVINETSVLLDAEPSLAVLIHEPDQLPAKFRTIAFRVLPGLASSRIYMWRIPYRVTRCTIERTLDLRFPEVQAWFYLTFREPNSLSKSLATGSGPGLSPTTAISRFHFENAAAPVPKDFWAMLPTLMNPDIGGGNPADTGGTLLMIGHWMRQAQVGALVFPSARCDVAAVFQNDNLEHWQGWNLLDFRESPLLPRGQVITFVMSPWAWVNLPDGVKVDVAKTGSEFAGSFVVQNMVNYWALDYTGQLESLKIARAKHGREKPHSERIRTLRWTAASTFSG